jgi:hypothetical protein
MRKVKTLLLGGLLASALLFSVPTNAKEITFAYIFPNGCVGTHTYHSTFFGLITWETFEVVAC